MPPLAILDIDGTLVDTNYHHAIAWYRALRQQGLTYPLWEIHRRMGMGGEKLVADLAGDETEREHGEAIRAAEKPLYLELIHEVAPIPGAGALVEALRDRGHRIVLASSAKPDEVDHYLDLLDLREAVDGWTTGGDVEATKPSPDLVEAAIASVEAADGDPPAVLVGDSVWDCAAADRAGIASVGVLTGGFAAEQLRQAGAACVFATLDELRAGLDETPLGHG